MALHEELRRVADDLRRVAIAPQDMLPTDQWSRAEMAADTEDPGLLAQLASDRYDAVQVNVAKNPYTEEDTLLQLARSPEWRVYEAVLENPNATYAVLEAVLAAHGQNADWRLVQMLTDHPEADQDFRREVARKVKNLGKVPFPLKPVDQVRHTADIEHLFWLRGTMDNLGLDQVDVIWLKKNYPTHEQALKPFLLQFPGGRVRRADVEAAIANAKGWSASEYMVSYGKWTAGQMYLKRPQLVVKLNWDPDLLEDLYFQDTYEDEDDEPDRYKHRDPDFHHVYNNLLQWLVEQNGDNHPDHWVGGENYNIGWARVSQVNDKTWLIEELQSDVEGFVNKFLRQIERGEKPGDDRFQTRWQHQHPETLRAIQRVVAGWESALMSSLLEHARENGIRDVYIMTPETKAKVFDDAAAMPAKSTMTQMYQKLPRQFHFSRVKTDLGRGEDSFWYRRATPKGRTHS